MLHRILGCLRKSGYFFWNFVPNSGLGKFGHGTPTVSECDMNRQWVVVASTWRETADEARAAYSRRRSPTVDRTRRL